MTIDWTQFTPWLSLGGVPVGIAAALLILSNGRIAGISGIVAGLLAPERGDRAWRASFLIGLIGSPMAYRLVATLPDARIDAGYPTLAAAGLLAASAPATAPAAPAGTVCADCRADPFAR